MREEPRLVALERPKEGLWVLHGAGVPWRRVYLLDLAGDGEVHGGHALREQETMMVCVRGGVRVTLWDGLCDGLPELLAFDLDGPRSGLVVPSGWWREVVAMSGRPMLLCLASTEFSEGDYIRDEGEFTRWAAENA